MLNAKPALQSPDRVHRVLCSITCVLRGRVDGCCKGYRCLRAIFAATCAGRLPFIYAASTRQIFGLDTARLQRHETPNLRVHEQRGNSLKTAGLSKCDHEAGHFKEAYLAIRVEGRENSAT